MADENKNSSFNAFENSIDSFSHLNVNGDPNKEKRKLIPALLIRCLLIAVCIGLFGYAVFMIASSAIETDEVNELYDEIRAENLISEIKPATPLLEPAAMYTFQEMLNSSGNYFDYIGDIESVDELERQSSYYWNYINHASKYPDTYAWIYVDYTDINYPVMKGPYTDYYLYRNYKGEDSSAGSITAETNMSDTYSANINNVLYGHCMKNGSMFRTLKTFMESANRNTLVKTMNIEIYTDEGLYIYDVFGGYRYDGSFFAKTIFTDSNDFMAFLKRADEYNTLSVNPDYDENSKIVTLITCANVSSNEDERYVLHGILKSFIPASQL